ncbi:unnamed protein product [Schistosoma turkestanicum]|nr:unnamed protein product [Schistosoma turkestanicum]CAH8442759.1 unnamed protein product [Schistosoma turkestanicum]
MQVLFVSGLLGYCLFMISLHFSCSLECQPQPMYESRMLHCSCDGPSIAWNLNSSHIIRKLGKALPLQNKLQIYDFRLEDSGVYECFDSSNMSKECSSICLEVDAPGPYYKAIHDDSIPDADADEQERPYWHQKMKTFPEFYELNEEPIRLACYFYIRNKSITPLVQWIIPSDHDKIIIAHLRKLTELNCTSLSETQRNLTGRCYMTEITIESISGTDSFECNIRTPNQSDVTISNSFTVLQKVTSLLIPNLNHTDLSELEAPNFELFDELRIPSEVNSSFVNSDIVHSDLFTTSTGKYSTKKNSSLDISTLSLTTYIGFRFYLSNKSTCLSEEVNLICQLPRTLSPLEVWHLGQPNQQPRLLKASKALDSLKIIEKRYPRLDNSITLKLENLSFRDDGLYICKNDYFYKNITITVTDCSKSNFICRFVLSILVWMIIFITIATIQLILIYCIWDRRKSSRPVFCIPIDFLQKHAKSRCVIFFRKMNLMYGVTTSSSQCSAYSRSDTSKISIKHTEIKLHNSKILTSLSQRLLHQQLKYFSRGHQSVLCKTKLLDWLNRYLNANPKTCVLRSSFTIESLLDEGDFGIVYKGKLCVLADTENTANNTEIAVKTLQDGFRNRQLINLIQEAKVLSELEPHPHIVTFYGLCVDRDLPYILLELAIYGNLRDFLLNRRPPGINFWADERIVSSSYVIITNSNDLKEMLSDSVIKRQRVELLKFALDIADALLYFETLSLFHRDVAARNVVITEGFIAKLCDFGYACTQEELNNGYMEMDKDYLAVRWMAPECLTTPKCYTSKCDVWSYGIVLWEIFSLGGLPYPGIDNGQIIDWLNNGNRNSKPYLSTNSIYQLMLECWSQDPDCRPGFYDICSRIAMMKSNYGYLEEADESTKGYVELMLDQDNYLELRQYLR